jgi:hypothetical protein
MIDGNSSDSETIEIIIHAMHWGFVEAQKSDMSALLWASLRQFLDSGGEYL